MFRVTLFFWHVLMSSPKNSLSLHIVTVSHMISWRFFMCWFILTCCLREFPLPIMSRSILTLTIPPGSLRVNRNPLHKCLGAAQDSLVSARGPGAGGRALTRSIFPATIYAKVPFIIKCLGGARKIRKINDIYFKILLTPQKQKLDVFGHALRK